MTAQAIRIRMTRIEVDQLSQLVKEFCGLVGTERDYTDPALVRLTPTPYLDDAEAAQEFHHATRKDLLDRRLSEASLVHAHLVSLSPQGGSPNAHETIAEVDLTVSENEVDAWLRTLTALRLVIATRLGIVGSDDRDDDPHRSQILDWLGYRLDLLTDAANALLP